MNPSDGFYQGNAFSGVGGFCKERWLCSFGVHKPRADRSGVRGRAGGVLHLPQIW